MEPRSDDSIENVTTETCLGDEWGSEINDKSEGTFNLTIGAGGFITGRFPVGGGERPIVGGKCDDPAIPGGKKRLTLIREEGENLYIYTGTIRVVQTIPFLRLEARGKRRVLGKSTDALSPEGDSKLLFNDDWVGTRPPT